MTEQVLTEPPSRPQSRYWLTLSALLLLLLPALALASLWLAQPSYDPARRVPAAERELVPASEAWLDQHRHELTAQWQVCRDGWLPCPEVRDEYFDAVSALTHSDFGIIEPRGPTEVERVNPWTTFYLLTILTLWIGVLVARELNPKRRQAARVDGAAAARRNAEQAAALAWWKANRPGIASYYQRTRRIRRLSTVLGIASLSWLYLFPLSLPLWPLALALGALSVPFRFWTRVRLDRLEACGFIRF